MDRDERWLDRMGDHQPIISHLITYHLTIISSHQIGIFLKLCVGIMTGEKKRER